MPPNPASLVLEDGTVFRGESFGADVASAGEVVFSTAMTGYQEMLTDPSFAGQVLVLTYPMAGNYGINAEDVESKRIQVAGLVVHEACDAPSHWRSRQTLGEYLASENIPGIAGIDTRALTRKLRSGGVMMGAVTADETPDEALARLRSAPKYGEVDLVRGVSTDEPYEWPPTSGVGLQPDPEQGPPATVRLKPDPQRDVIQRHVVVVDDGVKYNIMRLLADRGCRVTALPPDAAAETILALSPDGILFSPGRRCRRTPPRRRFWRSRRTGFCSRRGRATRSSSTTRWRRCAR